MSPLCPAARSRVLRACALRFASWVSGGVALLASACADDGGSGDERAATPSDSAPSDAAPRDETERGGAERGGAERDGAERDGAPSETPRDRTSSDTSVDAPGGDGGSGAAQGGAGAPGSPSGEGGSAGEELPVQSAPRVAAGPRSLAASGVAVLSVEGLAPEAVLEARFGGQALEVGDGARFQWLEEPAHVDAAPRTLAVRAPGTLAPGPTTLELVTGSGVLSWPLEIVATSGVYPDSPQGILWPSAASSGVFPISTVAAGLLIVDGEEGPETLTTFQYRVQMRSAGREGCDVALVGEGELYGAELVVTPQGAVEQTHPIAGEYELHEGANSILATIDRSSSGGVVERYFGGWVSYPGNTDVFAPELPAPAERAHPPALDAATAMVVLTSEHTGRQLLMSRRLADREETSRVRGCLFELP